MCVCAIITIVWSKTMSRIYEQGSEKNFKLALNLIHQQMNMMPPPVPRKQKRMIKLVIHMDVENKFYEIL